MNSNIDFSDFHKISVDRPSKCRKITKHRFEIFSILTTIIVIILIIVYADKNKQENKKDDKLSILKNNYKDLDNNLTDITKAIDDLNNTNITLDNEIFQFEIYKKDNQSALNEIKKRNEKLKLINKIFNDIKTKKTMTERLNNLQIKDSNIQTDVHNFENEVSMKVKNKCFDSEVYGFKPEMFYKNCAGNALLFLIKTEDGEKIGAYTSESKNENMEIRDEKSMLINFDNNEFYKQNKEKTDCNIIYNLNDFPKFGGDLEINENSGESFSYCYGSDEEMEDFVNSYQFYIEILEVYKVEEN